LRGQALALQALGLPTLGCQSVGLCLGLCLRLGLCAALRLGAFGLLPCGLLSGPLCRSQGFRLRLGLLPFSLRPRCRLVFRGLLRRGAAGSGLLCCHPACELFALARSLFGLPLGLRCLQRGQAGRFQRGSPPLLGQVAFEGKTLGLQPFCRAPLGVLSLGSQARDLRTFGVHARLCPARLLPGLCFAFALQALVGFQCPRFTFPRLARQCQQGGLTVPQALGRQPRGVALGDGDVGVEGRRWRFGRQCRQRGLGQRLGHGGQRPGLDTGYRWWRGRQSLQGGQRGWRRGGGGLHLGRWLCRHGIERWAVVALGGCGRWRGICLGGRKGCEGLSGRNGRCHRCGGHGVRRRRRRWHGQGPRVCGRAVGRHQGHLVGGHLHTALAPGHAQAGQAARVAAVPQCRQQGMQAQRQRQRRCEVAWFGAPRRRAGGSGAATRVGVQAQRWRW
jgi:hypothetical protein